LEVLNFLLLALPSSEVVASFELWRVLRLKEVRWQAMVDVGECATLFGKHAWLET
jgi:hypothetical protein